MQILIDVIKWATEKLANHIAQRVMDEVEKAIEQDTRRALPTQRPQIAAE
jgi:hypothetical protein